MKKTGYFFKSIVPFLIVIVLQIGVMIPMYIIYMIKLLWENGGDFHTFLGNIITLASDQGFLQNVNIVYSIAGLIVFGIWYQKVFIKPFRNHKKIYPTGFSFHTIVSIIFMAIGLQYVTIFVVNIIAMIRPAWITQYNTVMETAGYSDASVILLIYTIILAPFVEELIFRGLTFRYARHAMPFWAANIWQALLFGVMHMNFVQGIYAFIPGIFLGWVCHRGRGIKYSVPVHIVYNILGCFCGDLFSFTTSLSYPVFIGLGIALTIFAVWLFYTDFEPEHPEG